MAKNTPNKNKKNSKESKESKDPKPISKKKSNVKKTSCKKELFSDWEEPGKCCFCNQDCNPCSQCCGWCARSANYIK